MTSYADVAASGPQQSPEEAAAPQPPIVQTDESTSTSSLIDVDTPSITTVPSDFDSQEVKTTTQAERLDREAEVAEAERKHRARRDAAASANDSWLTRHLASLGNGSAGALAAVNALAVVGVSGFLGYRAWGLWERGRLTWQNAALGLGVLGVVGAFEGVFGGSLYKAKGKKN